MKLVDLLKDINYELICGDLSISVFDICYDSRKVKLGDAFVALVGIDSDGHDYIGDVITKGCKCIIVCKDIDPIPNATIIKIDDTRTSLSFLSANLFDNPGDCLIKIGITGTKGKTSISWMIKSILEANGEAVGVIGTIGTYINGKLYEHKNTTPESYLIQKYMREMVDSGVKYLIMEVSSQALKVGRVNNIMFDYGIFTNLSIDHVGPREHPDFDDYVNCKSKLFSMCKRGILNIDDPYYERMVCNSTCDIKTYGKNDSDYMIENIKYINEDDFMGGEFYIPCLVDTFRVSSPGLFSIYNACSATIVCSLLGISNDVIKKGLANFSVNGRCEIFNIKDFKVVIDFAHNKTSMESIINTMKQYEHNRIITIFGCGGGRSFDRRYELGEVSGKLSDLSIVTMDNPRNDDVNDINKDIVKGIIDSDGKYIIITDRKEAILYALNNAVKEDIILILGKGHEKFQEIKGVIYPFDEKEIIDNFKERLK